MEKNKMIYFMPDGTKEDDRRISIEFVRMGAIKDTSTFAKGWAYGLDGAQCIITRDHESEFIERGYIKGELPPQIVKEFIGGEVYKSGSGNLFMTNGQVVGLGNPVAIMGIDVKGTLVRCAKFSRWGASGPFETTKEEAKVLLDRMKSEGWEYDKEKEDVVRIEEKPNKLFYIRGGDRQKERRQMLVDLGGSDCRSLNISDEGSIYFVLPNGKIGYCSDDSNMFLVLKLSYTEIFLPPLEEKEEVEGWTPKIAQCVLCMDEEVGGVWTLELFSHIANPPYPYACLTRSYRMIIPLEGNEYLVGKNEEPKVKYKINR